MIRLTDDEEAVLEAKAAEQGVTVSRLMFESAMTSSKPTSTKRKKALAEIFMLRRLFANHANNTNQIARLANTEGRFPAEARYIYRDYRRLVDRLEVALEDLHNS